MGSIGTYQASEFDGLQCLDRLDLLLNVVVRFLALFQPPFRLGLASRNAEANRGTKNQLKNRIPCARIIGFRRGGKATLSENQSIQRPFHTR